MYLKWCTFRDYARQLPKLQLRVRFPSPAPTFSIYRCMADVHLVALLICDAAFMSLPNKGRDEHG